MPSQDEEHPRAERDEAGLEEGGADFAEVHLGHDAQVQLPHRSVGSQHRLAAVVRPDDAARLTRQCAAHGFGGSGAAEGDSSARIRPRVPPLEDEHHLVALQLGQRELAGFSDTVVVLVCIDDLADRGRSGTLQVRILAVDAIEPGDRFDETGLGVGGLDQSARRRPRRGSRRSSG